MARYAVSGYAQTASTETSRSNERSGKNCVYGTKPLKRALDRRETTTGSQHRFIALQPGEDLR